MTSTPTPDQIAARVRRFTPSRLDATAWAAAREPVVQAVLAIDPPTQLEVDYFTTHVTLFLAGLSRAAWDRNRVPDIAQLLTAAAIETFTSETGMPGRSRETRAAARKRLRRIMRAIHGVQPIAPASRQASKTATDFWQQVTDLGPFPVLVAAYEAAGASLHSTSWMHLADSLVTDLHPLVVRANAAQEAPSTFHGIRVGATVLREAAAPKGVKIVATEESVSANSKACTAGKRPSRAAGVRMAREAQAAAQRPRIATPEVLAPELASMVEGWCPQGVAAAVWEPVAVAAELAMTAYAPTSKSSLMNIRSVVADYCLWLHARPGRARVGDLAVEELLAVGMLEAYVAGPLADRPGASQGTARSVLRRVIRNLAPGEASRPIAYTPVQPPYSEAECAAFVLLARNQPTAHLRRELSAVLALGLGAGLSPEDSRLIAPCHVREVDLGDGDLALTITVPGDAPRGRVVVVRRAYEPLLREVLALHKASRRGHEMPLYGVNPRRRNGATHVTEKAVTATGQGVDVNASRLRTTWLVACMSSPVPLGVLLHASALRSTRTLTDLVRYCPTPDPDAVAAVLRNIGNASSVQVAS